MHSGQTLSFEEKKSNYSHQLAEHTLRQWQSVRREQEGISWPISRTKQSTRRKSSTRFIHPKLSAASRNAGADGKDPSEDNKVDAYLSGYDPDSGKLFVNFEWALTA
ncbi:hypothetical protein HHX47_DHR1001640 [Lentinula edodes]|nr:hypothetical protein HHX47_DHR1001640 [Lentinula edodes]